MTRPAPITRADLARYPHLQGAIDQAEQQHQAAPVPVPAAERAEIVIPVPRLPVLPDPDRMEHGVYGFISGVVFMGILGIIGRMM